MADNLTLMAVHAHPDDEASSTGGVLARYGAEGVRTVLVTCTNGEFGDAPGGIKPGDEGHDEQEVAEIRLGELRESAKILGVTDLELLGYHDSGMVEWDYKSRPDAFCNVPLADVAARIGGQGEEWMLHGPRTHRHVFQKRIGGVGRIVDSPIRIAGVHGTVIANAELVP